MSPRRPTDLPAQVDAPGGPWAVEVRRGSPADLHEASAAQVAAPTVRRVVLNEVVSAAWVLGSTQRPELLRAEVRDAAATGTGPSVVRRRSGGGLVPLAPGAQLWVDVVVPMGDAHWADDPDHLARRAGAWWSAVLRRAGVPAHRVRTSSAAGGRRPGDRELGRTVCFAGLGSGEVELLADGGDWLKSVGVSQRRSRHGAVLQCLVPRSWDHDALVDTLDPAVVGAGAVEALRDALRTGASPGLGVLTDVLLPALLAELAVR